MKYVTFTNKPAYRRNTCRFSKPTFTTRLHIKFGHSSESSHYVNPTIEPLTLTVAQLKTSYHIWAFKEIFTAKYTKLAAFQIRFR